MALSTLNGYEEILDRVFRPEIGSDSFEAVLYSRLAEVVADHTQDVEKKVQQHYQRSENGLHVWLQGSAGQAQSGSLSSLVSAGPPCGRYPSRRDSTLEPFRRDELLGPANYG